MRDGLLPFLFRALVQGPISATSPAAAALTVLNIGRWIKARGSRSLSKWIKTSTWMVIRAWVVLEVLHYIRFWFSRRELNRRRHKQAQTRQVGGRRTAALQHALQSLEIVAQSHDPSSSSAAVTLAKPRGLAMTSSKLKGGGVTSCSMLELKSCRSRLLSSSSKKDLQSPLPSFANLQSAESLLRMWDHDGGSTLEDGQTRLLELKRADISGWFCGADVKSLRRGNLEEWIAEYFFQGSTVQDVIIEDRPEFNAMVQTAAAWIGLPDMPYGRNPAVRCMLMTQDPLTAVHRPLWIYGLTGWAVPALTKMYLHQLGFIKYTAGVLQYWHRPRGENAGSPRAGCTPPAEQAAGPGRRTTSLPIVFCHGLGIGVLPYVTFVCELGSSGSEIFLLDLPHISLRQSSDVPSARETVACATDMLAGWGHHEAHFVGHSFGTIIVSWMLKYSQAVASASLLDPVCFLLVKHDLLSNSLYREHVDPLQIALTFFVFRELYIANTLARNFFWQQNELWPETVQRPMLVLLSGNDAIVSAHSVRRLLLAERSRRQDTLRNDELQRNGATVVRQKPVADGVGFEGGRGLGRMGRNTSSVELSHIQATHASELQVAKQPLEVLWYPDLVHCEFVACPKTRAQSAEALSKFQRNAEAPRR